MTVVQKINLALRGLMELGVGLGLGYWGYHAAATPGAEALLAVGAPVVGFGFWGMVDFRQAGRLAEPLRLVQELVVSGLAAVALYVAGAHTMGWTLGILSLVYHALVYASGDRLLEAAAD